MTLSNTTHCLSRAEKPRSAVSRSISLGMAGAAAAAVVITALQPVPAQAQLFGKEQSTIQTPMGRAPLTFADIVERVKPAVVSINATRSGTVSFRGSRNNNQQRRNMPELFPDLPDDHPLNEFFKNMPRNFGNAPAVPRAATGSGFVISPDGYVVTNYHVIDGATEITVSFDQKEKLDTELVGSDQRTDLALLKIKTKRTYPYVKLTEKPARVGDWVLAVGNPFGLGGTVTAGIVSALAREIGTGPYDYLQIDAAVNRGNSGGPTFNLDGEVVGINTAIYSPSGGNVGIAFAVPAATAKRVIEELKDKGSVTRGWLGVKIRNVDPDTVASLGLKSSRGAMVAEVTNGGPADKAGIRAYDVIKSVNGEDIEGSKELSLKIAEFKPNTQIDVIVHRANKDQTIKVMLGTFPSGNDEVAAQSDEKPAPAKVAGVLGLTLQPTKADGESGLRVTEIDTEGAAAKSGLMIGDIITHVNQQPVDQVSGLETAIKEARAQKRPKVMLGVLTKDQRRTVFVEIDKS